MLTLYEYIYIYIYISVGSRPNFRGRLIAEIFERLIDHGRPIEGKLKEKYNKKKTHENWRRNGRVMSEWVGVH